MVEFKKEKIKLIWIVYNLILLIFCVFIGISVYLSRKRINNNNKNESKKNDFKILNKNNKKEQLINENYSDFDINNNNNSI
jgi:hypothetical protein